MAALSDHVVEGGAQDRKAAVIALMLYIDGRLRGAVAHCDDKTVSSLLSAAVALSK